MAFQLPLFATTLAYADINKKQLSCPDLNTIHQAVQKLDSAMEFPEGYLVYTSKVAFSDSHLVWKVGVDYIIADSTEAAIELGKKTLAQAHIKHNEEAEIVGGYAACYYGPGEILVVGGNESTLNPLVNHPALKGMSLYISTRSLATRDF